MAPEVPYIPTPGTEARLGPSSQEARETLDRALGNMMAFKGIPDNEHPQLQAGFRQNLTLLGLVEDGPEEDFNQRFYLSLGRNIGALDEADLEVEQKRWEQAGFADTFQDANIIGAFVEGLENAKRPISDVEGAKMLINNLATTDKDKWLHEMADKRAAELADASPPPPATRPRMAGLLKGEKVPIKAPATTPRMRRKAAALTAGGAAAGAGTPTGPDTAVAATAPDAAATIPTMVIPPEGPRSSAEDSTLQQAEQIILSGQPDIMQQLQKVLGPINSRWAQVYATPDQINERVFVSLTNMLINPALRARWEQNATLNGYLKMADQTWKAVEARADRHKTSTETPEDKKFWSAWFLYTIDAVSPIAGTEPSAFLSDLAISANIPIAEGEALESVRAKLAEFIQNSFNNLTVPQRNRILEEWGKTGIWQKLGIEPIKPEEEPTLAILKQVEEILLSGQTDTAQPLFEAIGADFRWSQVYFTISEITSLTFRDIHQMLFANPQIMDRWRANSTLSRCLLAAVTADNEFLGLEERISNFTGTNEDRSYISRLNLFNLDQAINVMGGYSTKQPTALALLNPIAQAVGITVGLGEGLESVRTKLAEFIKNSLNSLTDEQRNRIIAEWDRSKTWQILGIEPIKIEPSQADEVVRRKAILAMITMIRAGINDPALISQATRLPPEVVTAYAQLEQRRKAQAAAIPAPIQSGPPAPATPAAPATPEAGLAIPIRLNLIEVKPVDGDLVAGIVQHLEKTTEINPTFAIAPADLAQFLTTLKFPVKKGFLKLGDAKFEEDPDIRIMNDGRIVINGEIKGFGSTSVTLVCQVNNGQLANVRRHIETHGMHSLDKEGIENKLANINQEVVNGLTSRMNNLDPELLQRYWRMDGFGINQAANRITLKMSRS